VPASLALLLALVVVVWLPFRRSAIGRAAYAVGSSEVAAYMSGVPIRRAKFVAYTLSGLLASVAGLFLTCVTYSGEASAANGSAYTLSRSRRSCWAACRCSAGRAAPSARSSER